MSIERIYSAFLDSTGVSTDSRRLIEGNIFFALKGPNFNGNQYAQSALEQGVDLAVVDEAENAVDSRTILVDDVLTTLQELASHHRNQLDIPVLAITGSNGKTTTKELCHAVLSKKFNTLATKGNLNNHIGVPLTLLSLTSDHEFAIIEMGANHMLEIARLSEIAMPDYGLITNIGSAHIEGFGSQENIFKAKTELYNHVIAHGKALFVLESEEDLMVASEGIRRITYGGNSSFLNWDIIPDNAFCNLEIFDADESRIVRSKLIGNYNASNLGAAAAVGRYFNVSLTLIKEAIENYEATNNRSQLLDFGKNKFILDAYNANPSSVKAALDHFEGIDEENKGVILGHMLELGPISKSAHSEVAERLADMSVTHKFLVGEEFKSAAEQQHIPFFATTKELKSHLFSLGISETLFLIKGSRGIGLEGLFDQTD